MKFPSSNRLAGQDFTKKVLTPILNRLVQIVEKRFSCQLDYLPVEDISNTQLVTALAAGRKPLRLNGILYFPVFTKSQLRGLAVVNESQTLSESEIKDLFDVIVLVLESTLMTTSSLEVLEVFEKQLAEQSQVKTNVVNLNTYRQEKKASPPSSATISQATMAFSCLIEGPNEFDIFKMAMEIHDRSQRYAFLNIKDLGHDVLKNKESFRQLGPCSLFIPELSALTGEQKEDLLRLLTGQMDAFSPQFISGTRFSQEDLIGQWGFLPALLARLSHLHMHMTVPFAEYKARGLIDFVFSSFCQSRS